MLLGDRKEFMYFYKEKPSDKIWIVKRLIVNENGEYERASIGEWLFLFDKVKIYSFWADCPQNLTEEELKIYEKEKEIEKILTQEW